MSHWLRKEGCYVFSRTNDEVTILCADSVPVGCVENGAPRQPFDEFSLSRVTYPARTWKESVKESDGFARWPLTDVMVIGDLGRVFRSFLFCGYPPDPDQTVKRHADES